jgi:hypothetical protein
MLPSNLVVIAACNPVRAQIKSTDTRERDRGKDWASGHYQVAPLPPSMDNLKWSFGSLRSEQEKEFIYRRLETVDCKAIPDWLRASMTELIAVSHEAMRQYAEENIYETLRRNEENVEIDPMSTNEAKIRARSVVSLRDIQRIFSLYEFFYKTMITDLSYGEISENKSQRRSMLLAIAAVYYLRLDMKSRIHFLSLLCNLRTEKDETETLLEVLDDAMNIVLSETLIPTGIAATRGLKENIFLTLVCSISHTPLMIIGPPGSSKVCLKK